MTTVPNRGTAPQRKRYGVCTGDKNPNCSKCQKKETQEFSAIEKFECKECGSTVRQVPPPPPPPQIWKFVLIGIGVLALGAGGYFMFSGSDKQEEVITDPKGLVSTPIDSLKTHIVIEPTSATDTVGKTIVITSTTTPADAPLAWSTSDPAVATVADGQVTLLKEGNVEITCTLNDTTKATSTITVVPKKSTRPEGEGPTDDPTYVRNYSLPYGTYTGPAANGVPDGLNGEVKVTKGFNLDLKSGGATLRLEPGDRIVNCKFRNGKLVQGFLKRANGEGKNFNIGI